VTHGSAEGLVSFVVGGEASDEDIRARMLAGLPRYMMPAAIHRLETMPQNVNGKIDRRALVALLDLGVPAPARAPEPVA
jgi:acyl-CoA synthetase (AMP-forming)/AMP-acid ligase II